MRAILILLACSVMLSLSPVKKTEKTYYYYCFSKSGNMAADGTPIKQTIMYNKICSMSTDDNSELKLKAKQWGDWVESRCVSKIKCTSDTHLYETEEKAEKAYGGFLSFYGDTSKYTLQLVDFR